MSCSTHQADINDFYYDIVNTVQGCIRKCIPTRKLNRHFIVGWNDEVKYHLVNFMISHLMQRSQCVCISAPV